ncbi:hypothetical protein NDU88_001423, partial [Pleurodeles waltl]
EHGGENLDDKMSDPFGMDDEKTNGSGMPQRDSGCGRGMYCVGMYCIMAFALTLE